MKPLSEILDEKSVGKSEFQLAVCKDDWMTLAQLHKWLDEAKSWCDSNGFTARYLEPESPIIIEGKDYANERMNLSLVEFTKINKA